jgi:elongation factor P hydroxylase
MSRIAELRDFGFYALPDARLFVARRITTGHFDLCQLRTWALNEHAGYRISAAVRLLSTGSPDALASA